ncbi:MAG: hypothetical protein GXP45_03730 [bacterium]|nr:hypothetical protein [bacterium]
MADIKERDALDEKNMSKCDGQILVDTSDLTIDQQIDKVLDLAKSLGAKVLE